MSTWFRSWWMLYLLGGELKIHPYLFSFFFLGVFLGGKGSLQPLSNKNARFFLFNYEKRANILRRYHWFLRQMTSGEQAQKFHSDVAPDWLCRVGISQSEVLPSSRKCHFISMEFLRSFLRRREMLAVSQSNCGIKVILMLVWLCYNCFFFTERMHSVVVRYYHVHTKSTENVPSLWYKTACKSSRLLTYSLFVTNKLSRG